MAIDIENDFMAEIEVEKRRAAEAKASSSSGAGFFILKDGERAMLRPILNQFIPVIHHDLWNQATGKMDVSAICAQSVDGTKEDCKHCQDAERTKNNKLRAVKQFIVPVWLYGVKVVATGATRTYEKDGQSQPVQGLRYCKFKVNDSFFEFLLTAYKLQGDITTRDIVITQTGEKLTKKYDFDPKNPSPFTVENVPEQSRDGILEWIAAKNPPALLDNADPFPPSSAQQAAPAKKPNLDF